MTVASAYRTLLRGWVLLVVGAVLGLAAGLGVSAATPPTYGVTSAVYVAESPYSRPNGTDLVSSMLFSSRVASYQQVVVSDAVLEPVAARLGLPGGASALAGSVAVTVVPDSTVLTLSVVGPDPARAVDIANGVADGFAALVTATERAPGAAEPAVRAEVIDRASTPASELGPRTNANLAIGFLVGLLVAAALVLGRALLDRTVRSSTSLRSLVGGAALGTMPSEASMSADDESVRRVRDHILLAENGRTRNVLVMAGAATGAGTSALTAALARGVAPGGRVLLIDADLRHGSLSRESGTQGERGLADLLEADLPDPPALGAVRSLGDVDLLPAGTTPTDPGRLLGSARYGAVVAELRSRYDRILVDAGELSSSLDAAAVARHADGVVVVYREGSVTADRLTEAVSTLETVGSPILGSVLTAERRSTSRRRGTGSGSDPRDHRAAGEFPLRGTRGGTEDDRIVSSLGARSLGSMSATTSSGHETATER